MTLTSIVIPTYNGLPMLQQAVASIRTYTDPSQTPYELIVVDNASSDGTGSWCVQQGIRLISLPSNTGFPIACNKGLRLARGDQLLLLNNDVTVSASWLKGLLDTLHSDASIGMAGPVSNYVSGRQKVEHLCTTMEEFHCSAAEVYARSEPAQPILRLVGFCMLFKRELYDQIGELDERFSPGHYEDDDYCLRARMHGFTLMMCPHVFVHHQGSASFKRDAAAAVARLVETNRQRFVDKWKLDPAQFM